MTETRSWTPLDCPACGARCMSLFAKMSLGPARSMACSSCGVRVSVAALSSLLYCTFGAVLLTLAANFGMGSIGASWSSPAMRAASVALVLVIALPFGWLYARYIPLVVRRA